MLFLSISAFAQDIQFSQPYVSPLYLSPSYAGSTDGSRLVTNYRNQWANYTSYLISYDHYFSSAKSGLGLLLIKDMPGNSAINTSYIGLQYSYAIPINRFWEVRPALQATYVNSFYDYSKFTFKEQLVFGNQDISIENSYKENVNFFDASAGLLVYSGKIWAGVSVDHLLMPNIAVDDNKSVLPLKFVVFGGKKFELAKTGFGLFKSQVITLTCLYKQQQKFRQLDAGFYWQYKQITAGAWYRGLPFLKTAGASNNDAIILMMGYNLKGFKIAYSFDMTLSKLQGYSGNAHEVSLVFEFLQNQALKKKRFNKAIPSPKF